MNERYRWKAVLCTAFLLVFGGCSISAEAQVSISPVRVDLSDQRSKTVVQISNQQDTTASYQVEVVAWSQTDTQREVYSPTEEIVAVPPLFTLQPGQEQIVRIGMLTEADPLVERSYRMFVTELASPQEQEQQTSGVNMRLRLGIPVFVAPNAPPNATLDHFDSEQVDGQLFMHLRNSGNTHVRISEVQYLGQGMVEPRTESAAIYILSGQTAYVPVELGDGDDKGKVTIVTDTLGSVEYELSAAN